MKLHYPGDLVDDLINRVLGPDRYGGFVVVDTAEHDPADNQTTAHCRPVQPAEMRHVVRDPFGQLVLAVVQGADR